MLASKDLYFFGSHTHKAKQNLIFLHALIVWGSFLRSLLFSGNMCSHVFASHLHNLWALYGVERCYVECLLGIASLYRLVLRIEILLRLVQYKGRGALTLKQFQNTVIWCEGKRNKKIYTIQSQLSQTMKRQLIKILKTLKN